MPSGEHNKFPLCGVNLKVVLWFVYANDLESYTNSSVATGRTSTPSQIKGTPEMKKHMQVWRQ
jgi:hypothetical protein